MLLSHRVLLLQFVLYSCCDGILRNFFLYFVLSSKGVPVVFFTKFGFINRDISLVTSSKCAGSITAPGPYEFDMNDSEHRRVARGGQGGQLTPPPLRTKGPLFGTSCVKLLRPITKNG